MKTIPDTHKQSAIDAANTANAVWEMFADLDADRLPSNDVDAMQVQLMRWQRRNFGDVSPVNKVDVHMTLGVIEEFGEALTADEIFGDKGMLDGLGDICVYSGQLLNANRLAIRPVMDLADQLADGWDGDPDASVLKLGSIGLSGQLCHVLLKHEQKIRGYDQRDIWLPSLAYHVAAIIGWAKLEIYQTACEELATPVPKWDGMIQRTYLEVGGGVVLKRNWTVDRIAGQTSA